LLQKESTETPILKGCELRVNEGQDVDVINTPFMYIDIVPPEVKVKETKYQVFVLKVKDVADRVVPPEAGLKVRDKRFPVTDNKYPLKDPVISCLPNIKALALAEELFIQAFIV
jgi:hypothetical protein